MGRVEAQSADQIISPAAITTRRGSTNGQPISVLAVMDQFGADDNPAAYVSFNTPNSAYNGTQTFLLPTGVVKMSISTMRLVVNFKGPLSTMGSATRSIG
jgi:hypothetical protein